jgi:cobalt-zinc-cadmium efflux system outer membrane protein
LRLHRIIAALLVASSLMAGPGQAAPVVWDEARAAAVFGEANPRVTAIREQIEVARAEAVAAGVLPNPTLEANREQVFLAGGPAEENRLAVQAPIPVGGKRELRLAIAQSGIEAAEARADQQIRALIHDFRMAFVQAHRHEAGASVLADGLSTFRRLERVAETRQKAGESAGYDILRLRLGRSALDARLNESTARAGEERARLAGLLGRPIEGTLAPAELGTVPEAATLIEQALARRPDVRLLRAEEAQAALALELAERGRWPDPELALGLKQTNEPTVQGLGYTAGLVWALPVFDRGQGSAARARAERTRLQAEVSALETQLRVEIPAARASLLARMASIERLNRDVLARVPEVLRVAELAYREGEQGVTPLLDAHQAALEARLQSLDLMLAARLARLDLERLVGGTFPTSQRSNP